MKFLFIFILILINEVCFTQAGYAKTYQLKLNDNSGINYYPNYISSLIIDSNIIYSFIKATDTSLDKSNSTGFARFLLDGNLISYESIISKDTFHYFYPEEILTFDHETYYTSINIKAGLDGLLKYNYKNKESQVFPFKNTICDTCYFRFQSMSKGPHGELIVAHAINIPTVQDPTFTKVQITKLDTNGHIYWTKVFGEEPVYYEVNSCYSTYIDEEGNYYFGLAWDNDGGTYKNYVYKLDTAGNVLSKYSSLPKWNHAEIYDIIEGPDKSFYLSTNYNKNIGNTILSNRIQTLVVKLNPDLTFNKSLKIGRSDLSKIPVDRILISNEEDGIIGIFNNYYNFYYPRFDSTGAFIDSVRSGSRKATLTKINLKGDSLWTRSYTVRQSEVYHWHDNERSEIFDIKALSDKSGYIMGGLSFRYNAFEKLNEAPYVPLLIRVDNDGCIIPDCNKVSKLEDESSINEFFRVYPNPLQDRLIIQHEVDKSLQYSIIDMNGKVMARYISNEYGENSIIITHDWPSGSYSIIANDLKGNVSNKVVVKQ
ncbi:MAG: T9SS type A sorting domain-containing protein [Saprospiraceae bacterium]|nr:T9SS type A sorting domain-containing protein [Saprospiraceae bacterium]